MEPATSKSLDEEEMEKKKLSKEEKKKLKKEKKKKHKKERKRSHSTTSSSSSSSSTSSSSSSSSSSSDNDKKKKKKKHKKTHKRSKTDKDAKNIASQQGEEEEVVGPVRMAVKVVADDLQTRKDRSYDSKEQKLLPGEGAALAEFVRKNERIPRRGEVSWNGDEIKKLEDLGYVMSGSRHARMEAVRQRKEQQVITLEQKKIVALEEARKKHEKEMKVIEEMRQLLEKKMKESE